MNELKKFRRTVIYEILVIAAIVAAGALALGYKEAEIGRASCRERV